MITKSKLALIAAAAIAVATPAFAKTIHHPQNDAVVRQQQLYNSTVTPPAAYDSFNGSSSDRGASGR